MSVSKTRKKTARKPNIRRAPQRAVSEQGAYDALLALQFGHQLGRVDADILEDSERRLPGFTAQLEERVTPADVAHALLHGNTFLQELAADWLSMKEGRPMSRDDILEEYRAAKAAGFAA